ncbi:hypothetical protein DSECCO2_374070 [anaerobic digester metagenome]
MKFITGTLIASTVIDAEIIIIMEAAAAILLLILYPARVTYLILDILISFSIFFSNS